jgi:hypothetical protein
MNKDYTIRSRKDKLGLLHMFSKMFGILAILAFASCSKVETIEVKPDKIKVLDLSEKAMDIDIEAGKIIGTSTAMEYSITSTDGTDGTWESASEGNTPVIFAEGNVYVREAAFPWNVRLVKTIKPGMIRIKLDGVNINVANGEILGTSVDMEYSLTSTDGTNGTWITASPSNTTVDFIAGKVYVRQALAPDNVRLVATVQAAAAAPTLVGNDDTNTIAGLTALHEYKIDEEIWNVGTTVPDLTGTKSVQIRLKATATKLASLAQTISFTAGPVLYDNFEGTADLASRGWSLISGVLPVFSTTNPGGDTRSISLEKSRCKKHSI